MNPRRLLAHEWTFGGFMAVLTAALIAKAGIDHASTRVFAAGLAANLVLLSLTRRNSAPVAWRLRLAFYPVAMNVLFQAMATAVPLLRPVSADPFLQRVDEWIIGRNLSLRLEGLVSHPLTEVMSFCYVLFLPYLTFSIVRYLAGPLREARPFFAGLFTLYGVGFLGYLLVPAGGPIAAMASQFHVPLEGWAIARWTARIVEAGSNHVDAFPSLHCAVSFYLLLSDRLCKRWRFWLYLAPAAGLWISTIYLRYHYFVDVLAGFTLAFICLGVAARQRRRECAGPAFPRAVSSASIPPLPEGVS